jgi:hypothetical protein
VNNLPPDLECLGQTLTEATTRTMAARRRRRRLRKRVGACAAASMLVFVVTTPSRLVPGNSTRSGPPLTLATVGLHGGDVVLDGPCDTLHGGAGPSSAPPAGCVVVRLSPQLR